jgi:hypothetical protein
MSITTYNLDAPKGDCNKISGRRRSGATSSACDSAGAAPERPSAEVGDDALAGAGAAYDKWFILKGLCMALALGLAINGPGAILIILILRSKNL